MNDTLLIRLEELKNADFDLNLIEDKLNFTYELLEVIGNKDPYIRDELIYPMLARLLYRDVLPEANLLEILRLLFSESHLFYGIGEIDDTVFTRTFSSLQIAVLLYKHNNSPFIPFEDMKIYFKKFLEYYEKEVDLRGFLKEEGWAHSVAHAADVWKQFAQADEIEVSDLEAMFSVIKDKFIQSDYFYINNEDERTVSALELAIHRSLLDDDWVIEYLKSFSEYEKEKDYKKEFIINSNIKNLLRSLYFRVEEFHEEIEEVLFLINPFKK